jgi:glycosyltransferase involved in cell wall biosynthesis
MRVLVWQWGRRGAGPRYGADLAAALNTVPGCTGLLSLSEQAEILCGNSPPACDLPFPTYANAAGFVRRMTLLPLHARRLAARLRKLRLDLAICAMPGPLDLLMASALRQAGARMLVVVHDARLHPGDGLPLQMTLQRLLLRRADGLVALSTHVAADLRAQGLVGDRPLLLSTLPPTDFATPMPKPRAHGGRLRLLSFGRLLPYKGLDLLEDALRLLGPRQDMEMRVVGSGPEFPVLDRLRGLPGVTVENRWVPEQEVGAILAWADALVLSHREASQSGVAAAAIAAGRWVVATNVGGIAAQLEGREAARLCAPEPQALATALKALLENPPPAPPPEDIAAAWRQVAEDLVGQIQALGWASAG